jgi:hypothetical protein
MAASHSDSYQLSQDTTFQNRVQAALLAACISIVNEGWAVVFHRERSQYAAQIMSATANQSAYVALFANAVATDATCLSDATQAGTVVLTTGNRAAQAALVTDAHIDTAISSMFNAFIKAPQS